MGDAEQLRALHDDYVWRVNAAVGEDRLDLVWQLADEYLEQALLLMTAGEAAGCGRPDCTVCAGCRATAPGTIPGRPRNRWLRRLGRRRPR